MTDRIYTMIGFLFCAFVVAWLAQKLSRTVERRLAKATGKPPIIAPAWVEMASIGVAIAFVALAFTILAPRG